MSAERRSQRGAFAGVAIASLGGTLAVAALIVPSVLEDAISSAGLAVLASAVVFAAPLAIWLFSVGHLRAAVDPTRPGAGGGLLATLGGWATRRTSLAVGAIVNAAAPIMLIDPDGIYNALARVSLAALWISQLIVFAVFPRFAARRGLRPGPVRALSPWRPPWRGTACTWQSCSRPAEAAHDGPGARRA